jgi:succinyl-CoA synthetase beta subunit
LKLFEYEAKQIITQYGIAIPKGVLVNKHNLYEIELEQLNLSLVLKSQVLLAGRKKAGGILFANSIKQARNFAVSLLSTKIKKEIVDTVLIEEKIEFVKELYLSITIDRNQRSYVAIVSDNGGIDIE